MGVIHERYSRNDALPPSPTLPLSGGGSCKHLCTWPNENAAASLRRLSNRIRPAQMSAQTQRGYPDCLDRRRRAGKMAQPAQRAIHAVRMEPLPTPNEKLIPMHAYEFTQEWKERLPHPPSAIRAIAPRVQHPNHANFLQRLLGHRVRAATHAASQRTIAASKSHAMVEAGNIAAISSTQARSTAAIPVPARAITLRASFGIP